MSGVFISYRREDSGGYAGRLFDVLSARFGRENTFMDLAGIRGGDDFVRVIEEKIGSCDVLLAVIGERWLTIVGESGGRRLEAPGDYVRLEIAKALERGVPVIPVLVGKATMPFVNDLPDDLRALAVLQAMDLRDAHFPDDAQRLVETISRIAPDVEHRRWKLGRRRLIALTGVGLALAAVAGGVSLLRHGTPLMETFAFLTGQRVKIAGKWKAGVTYGAWIGVYPETFNFEVSGMDLSGSAGFLGTDRGIFDGKVEGDHISFMTKSVTEMDDKKYQDKHYYKGIVEGDTIQFTMNTDSEWFSERPVHFMASRVREAEKVTK